MKKARVTIEQEEDGLWVVHKGSLTLVENIMDECCWKRESRITIDDAVRWRSLENIEEAIKEADEE